MNTISRKLKRLLTRPHSMALIKGIVVLSLCPIILLLITWLWIWYTHDESQFALTMMDLLMKITDKITAPSVVACFIAYGAKLVDTNKNGIPDEFEKENDNVQTKHDRL